MPTIDELVLRLDQAEKDNKRLQEMVGSVLARLSKVESGSSRFDWSKITPYLPEIRSLVWMAAGLLMGGGGTYVSMPTPAPQRVEVPGPERIKEVPVGTVKSKE